MLSELNKKRLTQVQRWMWWKHMTEFVILCAKVYGYTEDKSRKKNVSQSN
jgi:hypothetical protein